MENKEPAEVAVCGECGAAREPDAETCWLCRSNLAAHGPYAPPRNNPYDELASWQISIGSLLATVTILAVALGVFRLAPGLGVMLAVVVVPAYIRTCVVIAQQHSRKKRVTARDRFTLFANSVGVTISVMLLLGAVAVAGFSAYCGLGVISQGRGSQSGFALIAAVVCCGAVALVFASYSAARTAVRRSRKRQESAPAVDDE